MFIYDENPSEYFITDPNKFVKIYKKYIKLLIKNGIEISI